MTASKNGSRLRIAGARSALVVALSVTVLSACSTALLDLLAYQVLANEDAMLYLGYFEDGYGVARLGTSTGALEVFRTTMSPDNVNGCAITISPGVVTVPAYWPQIYYTAELPYRIMVTDYKALDLPEEALRTDPLDNSICVRYLNVNNIYWATSTGLYLGQGGSKLFSGSIAYIVSFDLDRTTSRIYYLGISPPWGTILEFGIRGIDTDGSDEALLVTIGRYAVSNLLLLDGYLYYVTQAPNGIYRIKADGSEPAPTLLLTPTVAPQAVAVDPSTGTLYWIEIDESTPRRIMKAGPGETAGVPLAENLPKIDPNGFFFYRPE